MMILGAPKLYFFDLFDALGHATLDSSYKNDAGMVNVFKGFFHSTRSEKAHHFIGTS